VGRLLADLTEPQRQAVRHVDGPLLVLAGAGSGKTRVITRRAAHLAASGVPAWQVLAITFTNKAAEEMRERILALGVGREMTVCTFHSLCARLLRTHHERAGLAGNFTIFDESDRKAVVREAIHRCELDATNWPAGRVIARISNAKNALQTPADWAEQAGHWADRTLGRIYSTYERLLAEQHGLDFDDLLMRTVLLLQQDTELRDRLEERYRYVLIDEYQDTNEAQYRIAHLLTLTRRNLCATGDPDQSIYGWRGANIENILRFERDYPGAAVVRLEQNYRSTKRILSAASRLIAANRRRKEKGLWTENQAGSEVRVVQCADEEEEARFIAEEVAGYAGGGGRLSDVAVFYRINALSLPIEMALRRAGLAYQVARGVEFYGRKEIKDLLAYVRVLVNPADATSLRRIINSPPRGIGKTTVERLDALASRSGRTPGEVLADVSVLPGLGRSGAKVAQFAELLRQLQPLTELPAGEALSQIASHSGLRASLAGEGTADAEPTENLDALVAEARRYDTTTPDGSLAGWLEETSLAGDADMVDSEAGVVTLMTLHAAKGLEFPVVYVVGLEDGLLPLRRDDEAEADVEEERRLCFVGMTRAKQRLTLTRTQYRQRWGQIRRNMASPFLDDLPRDEIQWLDEQEGESGGGSGRGGRGLPPDIERWHVGSLVRHPEYGLGQILAFRPRQGRNGIRVIFDPDGQVRDFVLEYAELIRVDYDEVE